MFFMEISSISVFFFCCVLDELERTTHLFDTWIVPTSRRRRKKKKGTKATIMLVSFWRLISPRYDIQTRRLCFSQLTAFNNAGVVIRKHNCERHQRKRMSNTNTSKCIREEIQFLGWRARTKLFSQSYILDVATKWKFCEEDSLKDSLADAQESKMEIESDNPQEKKKFHSKLWAILITSNSENHLWRLFNECHSEL